MRAVLLLLTLSLTSYAKQGSMLDRMEATINSDIILRSDVEAFRRSLDLRAQLDPLFAGTSVASQGKNATNRDIVNFLIEERLIAQSYPVSDTDAETEINLIQANNKISRDQLTAAIKQQGFSFPEYFNLIKVSTSKRNLIDRDIRTRVQITDDDVKNHFFNHYLEGSKSILGYRLKMITVSPSNYKRASAAKEVATRALQALRAGDGSCKSHRCKSSSSGRCSIPSAGDRRC